MCSGSPQNQTQGETGTEREHLPKSGLEQQS